MPVDSRSNDRWFQHVAIIVSDMDQAYARLREHKVGMPRPARSACPTGTRTPAASRRSTSRIPTATRSRSWSSRRTRALRMAPADAIACSSASITPPSWSTTPMRASRFYRDGLGLTVAGESENYGIEQERLNNVFGARLRITGLTRRRRARHRVPRVPGPGRWPAGTRRHAGQRPDRLADAAADARPGDDEALAARNFRFVSPASSADGLDWTSQGGSSGDPDGHA